MYKKEDLHINVELVNKLATKEKTSFNTDSLNSMCSTKTSPFTNQVKSKKRSQSLCENNINYNNHQVKRLSLDTLPNINQKSSNTLMFKDFNTTTKINDIIMYIITKKLKIKDIDIGQYIKIFEDNLILNLEILCNQSPDIIDKLSLPLALETEIKYLIIKNKDKISNIQNKNNYGVLYKDISQEIKNKIISILQLVLKNNYYKNVLFDDFYSKLGKVDNKINKLIINRNMETKSNKLINTIKLIIKFLEKEYSIMDHLDNLTVIHLVLGVSGEDYNIFSQLLVKSIIDVIDTQMNNIIKDSLLTIVQELGNIMVKHYDTIKRGKKFYVYFRKHRKWHKCFCTITHQNIIINKYPDYDLYNNIIITNINRIELINEKDTRIIKQTNYCIWIILNNNNDYYICTDNQEYIKDIYDSIQVRIQAHNILKH